MNIDIFPWIVEHHYKRNLLEIGMPLISNGRIYINGKPLKEGSDKNAPYHGFLFLVDGLEIFSRLVREGMVNDIKDGPRRLESLAADYKSSTPLLTSRQFSDYLIQEEGFGEDGAYIYNSVTGNIVRVSELNNNPRLPNDFSLVERIPRDFVHVNGKFELGEIGTKTRIAIKIPASMEHIHAYQIKRSPYGDESTGIGMGKVTHFDRNGLAEEFFFGKSGADILGFYRHYSRNGDELCRPQDLIMPLSDLSGFAGLREEALKKYNEAA